MGGSRGWGWDRGSGTPGKSQVAISFLRHLDIQLQTPIEKQLDPSGPIASRGRSVRPSVKYVDNLKQFSGYPPPPPRQNFLDLRMCGFMLVQQSDIIKRALCFAN